MTKSLGIVIVLLFSVVFIFGQDIEIRSLAKTISDITLYDTAANSVELKLASSVSSELIRSLISADYTRGLEVWKSCLKEYALTNIEAEIYLKQIFLDVFGDLLMATKYSADKIRFYAEGSEQANKYIEELAVILSGINDEDVTVTIMNFNKPYALGESVEHLGGIRSMNAVQLRAEIERIKRVNVELLDKEEKAVMHFEFAIRKDKEYLKEICKVYSSWKSAITEREEKHETQR